MALVIAFTVPVEIILSSLGVIAVCGHVGLMAIVAIAAAFDTPLSPHHPLAA